jgi:hypothetical protein
VPQEAVPVVGQPEEISEIIPRFTLMLGEVKFFKIEAVEEPERASSPAIASMASEGGGEMSNSSSRGPFVTVVEKCIFLALR